MGCVGCRDCVVRALSQRRFWHVRCSGMRAAMLAFEGQGGGGRSGSQAPHAGRLRSASWYCLRQRSPQTRAFALCARARPREPQTQTLSAEPSASLHPTPDTYTPKPETRNNKRTPPCKAQTHRRLFGKPVCRPLETLSGGVHNHEIRPVSLSCSYCCPPSTNRRQRDNVRSRQITCARIQRMCVIPTTCDGGNA